MQRLKVLVLALLGVMVLSAVAVATASAAPSALNKAKVQAAVKFTGKGSVAVLGILTAPFAVECTSQTNEGEIEAGKPLGPVHVTFKGCIVKGTTGACTGLGDSANVILALFTSHIVEILTEAKVLGAAVLFLITTPIHFACVVAGLSKLILVKGELLCPITPVGVLAAEATVKCEQGAELGDAKLVKYINSEGKEVELKEGLLSPRD